MTLQLIEYLKQFMLEERFDKMQNVVNQRSEYILPVLENVVQTQNAGAVVRTCECLGYNKLCVIENENEFALHKDVVMGAQKWIDICHYNTMRINTLQCIQEIRDNGYRIVATTPHEGGVSLEDFDLQKGKAAIIFGTESTGISQKVVNNADEFITIPMSGFTESFNLSVSAALVLYTLRQKLEKSSIDFKLNDNLRNNLLLDWIKKSIRDSEKIIAHYYSQNRLQ